MSDSDTAVLCLGKARAWTAARRAATAVAVLVASMSCASVAAAHARGCANAHTSIRHTSRGDLQRTVVCLINQERHARGLPGLRENSRLNRSAQGWTNVMVTHRDFSHGADFASRISAVGFDWSNVGENIATGYATPSSVVTAWMASTGHCQNILNPIYRYVGTGVSDDSIAGYSTLAGTWTQDFGLLMGQHAASGKWGPAEGCPYN
ncbi:MAG TPA: CAP domain-containing protein [Solirubrobacteraceae bacterium]